MRQASNSKSKHGNAVDTQPERGRLWQTARADATWTDIAHAGNTRERRVQPGWSAAKWAAIQRRGCTGPNPKCEQRQQQGRKLPRHERELGRATIKTAILHEAQKPCPSSRESQRRLGAGRAENEMREGHMPQQRHARIRTLPPEWRDNQPNTREIWMVRHPKCSARSSQSIAVPAAIFRLCVSSITRFLSFTRELFFGRTPSECAVKHARGTRRADRRIIDEDRKNVDEDRNVVDEDTRLRLQSRPVWPPAWNPAATSPSPSYPVQRVQVGLHPCRTQSSTPWCGGALSGEEAVI
jgi:hypothetical protein